MTVAPLPGSSGCNLQYRSGADENLSGIDYPDCILLKEKKFIKPFGKKIFFTDFP